jgi:hypothetical protein
MYPFPAKLQDSILLAGRRRVGEGVTYTVQLTLRDDGRGLGRPKLIKDLVHGPARELLPHSLKTVRQEVNS